MPPKYVPGRNKKAKEEAAAAAAAAAGGSAPDAAAPTGGAGSDAASTVAGSDAATVASGAAAAAAAAATAAEDDFLLEAIPGEEHHQRLIADAMSKINITTSTYQSKLHPNSRDIRVDNLQVILKGKVLLEEATVVLNYGRRYALLGPNGCGKSLLLSIIGRRMVPIPENLDVYHLTSEVEPSELSALEAVMTVDRERNILEAAASELEGLLTGEDDPEQTAINDRLCEIYERLDEMGADMAEARASSILFGLGFTPETMHKKCREFSGGWRMRIALARALFVNPTCLLLDGPTAHLDMEAVVWLENYLRSFKKILLMVSHSTDFMDEVATDIIRWVPHKRTLMYYGGNFSQYVQTRAEQEENQMKRYEKQQADVAHIKDFVARFGHGTRKMAQQAQSREKLLQKMEEEGLVEAVVKESSWKMRFPSPGALPPPVLQLSGVTFGYPGQPLLYENVDFGVDLDSRVCLLGPNGKGKTTLLKLITGELTPIKGAVRPHPHLRIARFTQHFVDALDLTKTPLEHFGHLLKEETIDDLRRRLGRFGVSGEMQATKMGYLSDGIKARIVFAVMAIRSPHILLLDEPTNGLDPEAIDALADAIKHYEGGVILVSHDMRLISQVASEVYECDHRKITKLRGGIMDYKAVLQKRMAAAEAEFERQREAKKASGKSM